MRKTSVKRQVIILYILLGVIGLLNMFSATIFSGFKNIQADQIDTLFNAYILEHGYKAFFDSTYKWSFFNPAFYYPMKNMIFESDHLLGSAPIYWVLRTFLDWPTSFQLWGMIQTVLTYIATLALFISLEINPVVAAINAYVFAFGLPRIAQLSHPQLFAQFYMCFSLISLFKFLKKPQHNYFNFFMLFLTLQLFAGFYLGWFYGISLYMAFFFYGAFDPDALRRTVKELTTGFYYLKSFLFWAALNALLWFRYFLSGIRYNQPTILDHALQYLNAPMHFLTPAAGSLWSYVLPSYEGTTQENYVYPGLTFYIMFALTIIFVVVPFIQSKNKDFREFAEKFKEKFTNHFSKEHLAIVYTGLFTGIVMLLMTTNMFDFSVWSFIHVTIPGANAIRYAARIWIVAYLWIYIAMGLVITYVWEKTPKSKLLSRVVMAFLVFSVLEQIVIKPAFTVKQTFLSRIENASSSIKKAGHCDFSYFQSKEAPLGTGYSATSYLRGSKSIEAMWTTLYTGVPTINGYTAWLFYKFDKLYTPQDLAELTGSYGETGCVYNEDGLVAVYQLPVKK